MTTSPETQTRPAIPQDLPFNFRILLSYLVLFHGFIIFTDVANILAPLVRRMNYPYWVVGVFQSIINAAPTVPMIFSAYYLECRSRELPLFRTYSLLFIVGGAAICASSFLLRPDHSLDHIAIWALGLTVLFTFTCNGLFNTPAFDIIGKAISSERRAWLFGIQGALAAILVAILGRVVLVHLNTTYEFHIARRATFFTAFGFGAVALLLFWAIREPIEKKVQRESTISFWRYLLEACGHFKKDIVFTKYVIARALSYVALLYVSYVTIYATEVLGVDEARLPGYMLMYGAIAGFFGNLMIGWMANRFGYVFIFRLGFLGMILALTYWIFFPSVDGFVEARFPFVLASEIDYKIYLYAAGWFIHVPSLGAMLIWGRNYPLDIAPPEYRSTYISLPRTLMLPISFSFPAIGGWIVERGNRVAMGHGYRVNFAVAIVGLFLGFLFTFLLPNIRRRESREAPQKGS